MLQLVNCFLEKQMPERTSDCQAGSISIQRGPMGDNNRVRKSRALLELFYPIHYKAGMAVEDAMRARVLTRKQVAVLWLLRTEGGGRAGVRRKDIERSIKSWFEVSSSAITKSIRKMARAPHRLVEMVESPDSGREKRVFLTPRGEAFIATMIARGERFLQEIVEQLPGEKVDGGIDFLEDAIAVLEKRKPRRSMTPSDVPQGSRPQRRSVGARRSS